MLLAALILVSCCLGGGKCRPDNYSSRFRILNLTNSQDLVFGPTKIYNKNLLRFYSLNGVDTISHFYGPGPNPNPGEDSLLFVEFDYRKFEVVYVRLTNTDIDTLSLTYRLVDASHCCPDYYSATPTYYNNNSIQTIYGGVTIIKK